MSLVSGRLELDYCLFASNSIPAKPRFSSIVNRLENTYPEHLISCGEVQQLFIPVTKEQFEEYHNLGRVVSLIEGIGYCVVKKLTIQVAVKDINKDVEWYAAFLTDLSQAIQRYQGEGLVTSRIVITNFVSELIAW